MRKTMLFILALACTIGFATTASGEVPTLKKKPVVVRDGNLILTVNGDVFPAALPEDVAAPITLVVTGSIETADGSQPPPLQKAVIETAKDGYVNAEGLPSCTLAKLTARNTATAEAACRSAIVGRGHVTVRVAFPESKPFLASGALVAFNGGVKNGVTTLFIHSYVAVPAPTAVITTVKIKRIHNGPYGLRSVATIPEIAGGYGSLTSFELVLHRLFRYRGEQRSYLSGKCSHDSLLARMNDVFGDGTEVTGTLVRPCRVRH